MILYQSQIQAENSTCLSTQARVDSLIAELFLFSSNPQVVVMVDVFLFPVSLLDKQAAKSSL